MILVVATFNLEESGCMIILIGFKDRSEFVQEEIETLTVLTCVVFASSHATLFVLCRICKFERQGSLSFVFKANHDGQKGPRAMANAAGADGDYQGHARRRRCRHERQRS